MMGQVTSSNDYGHSVAIMNTSSCGPTVTGGPHNEVAHQKQNNKINIKHHVK